MGACVCVGVGWGVGGVRWEGGEGQIMYPKATRVRYLDTPLFSLPKDNGGGGGGGVIIIIIIIIIILI